MTWLALVYMDAPYGLSFLHECVCICLHWKRPYQKSESWWQWLWFWREFISESQNGSPLTSLSLGSLFLWYVDHCSPSCRGLSILSALPIQYLEENNLKSQPWCDLEEGSCIPYTVLILKDHERPGTLTDNRHKVERTTVSFFFFNTSWYNPEHKHRRLLRK